MLAGITPRFIEIGLIKIGELGEERVSRSGNAWRVPKKLDHFIITSKERGPDGNFVKRDDIMGALRSGAPANGARVNKDGNLVGIPIQLLYNTPSLNLFARYAAFDKKRCVCSSGDGITGKRVLKNGKTEDVGCMCEWLTVPGDDGTRRCKPNGKLSVVIRGIRQVGGCFTLRTTSWNTISSIYGSLVYIESITSGVLSGINFQLVVFPQSVVSPDGKQQTAQIVSIVYPGTVDELRKSALVEFENSAAYIAHKRRFEAKIMESDMAAIEFRSADDDAIAEEFYPESESSVSPDDSVSNANVGKSQSQIHASAIRTAMPEEYGATCASLGIDPSSEPSEADAVKLLSAMEAA